MLQKESPVRRWEDSKERLCLGINAQMTLVLCFYLDTNAQMTLVPRHKRHLVFEEGAG